MYRLRKRKGEYEIVKANGIISDSVASGFILKRCDSFNENSVFVFGRSIYEHSWSPAPKLGSILVCDPNEAIHIGRVYDNKLYVPCKSDIDPEAQDIINKKIKDRSKFDLYVRYYAHNYFYTTVEKYAKWKFDIESGQEIDNLELISELISSPDKDQSDLAQALVMMSSYSSLDKQILLEYIDPRRITKDQINKLNPKIKDYAKSKLVDQIKHAYRNIIERYDIEVK